MAENVEIETDSLATYNQIKQRKANQEQAATQDELKDLILDLKKEVKSLKNEIKKSNGSGQ